MSDKKNLLSVKTITKCFMASLFLVGFSDNVLASMFECASVTFRLSIKHDGIRPSTGDEELAYSSLWDGGDGATVAIAQDGAAKNGMGTAE